MANSGEFWHSAKMKDPTCCLDKTSKFDVVSSILHTEGLHNHSHHSHSRHHSHSHLHSHSRLHSLATIAVVQVLHMTPYTCSAQLTAWNALSCHETPHYAIKKRLLLLRRSTIILQIFGPLVQVTLKHCETILIHHANLGLLAPRLTRIDYILLEWPKKPNSIRSLIKWVDVCATLFSTTKYIPYSVSYFKQTHAIKQHFNFQVPVSLPCTFHRLRQPWGFQCVNTTTQPSKTRYRCWRHTCTIYLSVPGRANGWLKDVKGLRPGPLLVFAMSSSTNQGQRRVSFMACVCKLR